MSDEPTLIDEDGDSIWLDENERIHRDGGPALVYENGGTVWYRHGEIHREDGPAAETEDSRTWYWNGNMVASVLPDEDHPLDRLQREEPELLPAVLAVAKYGDDFNQLIESVRAAQS